MIASIFPDETLTVWSGLLDKVAAAMAARGAHPARTFVVLPFAQLMPLAARLWAQRRPDGFAPHFETSQNWARRLRSFSPAQDDLAFDPARDILTAQSLLEQAGLGRHGDLLASALVEAAGQLASKASAMAPNLRPAWLNQARTAVTLGLDANTMALETAVAQLALVWAATTSYATDVFFESWLPDTLDCVVLLDGFLADPLAGALQALWGDRATTVSMPDAATALNRKRGAVSLHPARDTEDEAQRAAACVLNHIEAGRTPVALAAVDRVVTRRIRAMLDARGVPVRDENGWKLSTTRAAAQVMGALRACAWNAPSDAVLDWLKNSPAQPAPRVSALEQAFRKSGTRLWPVAQAVPLSGDADAGAWHQAVDALRASMARPRPLALWLAALRDLLAAGGQWEPCVHDAAGLKLLAVLRLDERAVAELQQFNGGDRRWDWRNSRPGSTRFWNLPVMFQRIRVANRWSSCR